MWNEVLVLLCNTSRHACTYSWESNIESIITQLCCKCFVHEWKQLKQENSWPVSVRKTDAWKENPGVELVLLIVQITPTHIRMSTSKPPFTMLSLHHTHIFQTSVLCNLKTDESQNNQKGPSHKEWSRASLEILALKAIVQHCVFPKVLALTADL